MGVRPFFTYFGGKWRDTPRHFPLPACDTIIEPFAGSAGYALRYPDRDVLLIDRDPIIVGLWRYLISVSADELMSLPDITGHVDDLAVRQEAKWLIGFWCNKGVASPRKSPSSWMRSGIRPGSFWGPEVRQRLASQLDAIRHWEVREADYSDAPDVAATWFVDPPYQTAGTAYTYGSEGIDFAALGEWCRARQGQVIVCEQTDADWLPFSPLPASKTARAGKRSPEAVWTNEEAA